MRAAILLCALLGGCTLSDSLRHDDIRSLWMHPPNTVTQQSVVFATDRQADGSALGYGLHWDSAIHCGVAELEVPGAFVFGQMPRWPKARLAPPPVACDLKTDMDGFAAAVAARARGCGRVLLFVHGYNQTFASAILRAGQIATDTQWHCAVAAFSWSSEGKFDRYAADIERSGYAAPELIETLRALDAAGLKIEIVAHSMGARVTLTALAALCNRHPVPVADELLLVAPDVSSEHDNDDFGHLLAKSAPCLHRATVYASDNDLILVTSEGVHGGIPRAGRVPSRDLQYLKDGKVDVVDASAAPGDPFGHGYFVLSYEMMDDMMWVLSGLPIERRAAPDALGGPTLTCGAAGCGDGHYVLRVAKNRGPDFQTRMLRALWPLIFRVQ
ncbi:MAG: alpha/beta hydrolase [Rhizomicrobium sp.]